MNTAKRELADLIDGFIKFIHIVAAIFAVRIFVELADPTNTTPAVLILLGIVGVGIADLVIVWPLWLFSTLLRSTTRL